MNQENADTKSLIYSLGNQGLYENQVSFAGQGQPEGTEPLNTAVDAEYFNHQMLDI
jgi:hypothetical protein